MALDTYANLKTSVADWLWRSDLTAMVPDFIALAEAQISRRLVQLGPPREMFGRSTATITGEFSAIPSDCMYVRSLWLSGQKIPLRFVDDPEKIVERKQLFPSEAGDPQVAALVGTEIQLWPWTGVTASYTAELTYCKRVPALSDTATTNWLLTLHPDAYLYGSLLQAAPYLKNDERLQTWGTIFTTIISDISEAGRIGRMAPTIAMPVKVGGTP